MKKRNKLHGISADEAHLNLVLPPSTADHCDRKDLTKWSARGGVLPRRLARHLDDCPPCAAYARRIGHLHTTLETLRADPTPLSLYEKTQQKALRMLRRATRASAEAQRALQARPNLSAWQRAQLHAARLSMSAAAAVLVLVTRSAIEGGVDRTRAAGEALAQSHWERHIDPDGEWFDNGPLT